MVYIELTKENVDLHIYMCESAKLMQINPISVGLMEVIYFVPGDHVHQQTLPLGAK